jgi:hypothetical protein
VSNTQLTFIISGTSVSYAEVLRSSQAIVRSKTHRFLSTREAELKEELSQFVAGLNLNADYKEYSLAWCSPNSALLPTAVFSESTPEKLAHLVFGDAIEKNNLDFNRISELSIVNVYEIPLWIKSFFIIKFPQILIQHEQTLNLRALFQGSVFKLKIVVSVFDDYFSLNIIYKSELIFANSYGYTSMEDIVYYTQFAVKSKNIQENKAELLGITSSPESEVLFKEFSSAMTKIQASSMSLDISSKSHFQQQTLCV